MLATLAWLAGAVPDVVSAQSSALAWTWSGAITHDGATVVARVGRGVDAVRLVVTPDRAEGESDARTYPDSGFQTPEPHGVARFRADGLAPATRYRYRVETPHGQRLDGRFRTWARGPFSFRIAFASCASTGSNHGVFDAIRTLAPDLFVHMGDFHYLNIGKNDVDAFRRAYDRVLASPRQGLLFRTVPITYIFDDHDFGDNDSHGESESGPAAIGVYRERVPHYPLHDGSRTLEQSFTIGRVRVIVSDTRAARAPLDSAPPRTMLGEAQVRWLMDELTAARDAPLVIWVNSVPWITRARETTSEGWAPYGEERTRLADHIESVGLTRRLVMLSGDAHMSAIDDGTNSAYTSSRTKDTRGFVVAHAAPLDRWTSYKGGPYSHGVSRRNHQFGLLDVADTGTSLTATITVRHWRTPDAPVLRLTLRCEREACVEVPSQ